MSKQTAASRRKVSELEASKQGRFKHAALTVVGATVIFLFGWGIGSGRIHFSALSPLDSQNSSLPSRLDMESVQEVYQALRDNYDGELTVEQLLDGIKQGLAESTGDVYTEYLNPEESKEFRNDLNGTFSGIGAELGKEGEAIIIVAPIAGYPAQKAGLQPKDVIISVDDKPTAGMTLTQAVNIIRGPSGTPVKLKILRGGVEQDFTITRESITIPSVEWEVKNNIGYITISTFSEDTPRLAARAAQEFRNQKVRGVVVDVRGNPGGLVDSTVDVASLWLPTGATILTEQRGGKVIKSYKSKGNSILQDVPTVVLIDESSASSSEILAGALQDNQVATVIGMNSFGKGSVQSLIDLPSGGVLKVTIARWFTPDGQNIDKGGITPDIKIDRTIEDVRAGRDPQKDAATQKLQQ